VGGAVAESAAKFLEQRRILVRRFPSHALTASFLRVSVGTNDEMLALNQALDGWERTEL
jgi:histidinol-phosphate aminotransferase